MRTATLFLIASIAQSAFAAPRITAHVSDRDVAQISAVVHAATRETILSIDPIYESKPVTGSIPRKTSTLDILGPGQTRMRDIVIYERTDLVGVRTSDGKHLPMSYRIQKLPQGWKIIYKRRVMD